MTAANEYRTKTCAEISEDDIGQEVRAAGWVETIRDHGGIIFIDLRDHYGVVQVVVHEECLLEGVTRECVISVAGPVVLRSEDTYNSKIATGTVEIRASSLTVLGKCVNSLPFEISAAADVKEDIRLRYRFLDLRNPGLHSRIVLRSRFIAFLREKMQKLGFLEVQTPILSASSPEGARDYLIPSRKHRGRFYALPQAPQIFKQLLMVSGFDRYFQIAPCFRDEDSRADRSPGEFYQLDFEMAFATQEEVFAVAEEVLSEAFSHFSELPVSAPPFPRIPYHDAMLKYGTDKPDLRNPLEIIDISDLFVETGFAPFRMKTVRAICVPDCAGQPRSFFEHMLNFAMSIGMKGLGYIKVDENMNYLGPIDKFLSDEQRLELKLRAGLKPGCVLYFIADRRDLAPKMAGQIRTELGQRLGLLKEGFRMCFITDFPMYEAEEETGKIIFTHNPFSMPQGGLKALEEKDPLDILACQYDIVCNGVELSSGAVRNHDPEIMLKAFEIAGYEEAEIIEKFSALYSAFRYGAPPHAGMAPGVDRMLMLITGEQSIREVIAFPMNSNAQDLLLGAPGIVSEAQLRETHIKIR
ncbi:aspartate--tRNA ligase [Papillibacter cinnamivorans]|uniref:Aspartate--tRNA(Asp/Asn) ligase n=1 Tax=Papillibacter cinnamivorans DSM 12816 TaxID=1122930 RepID=A0A1W2CN55_9FIRM|nr:aspartate--tRNA ligase [Papillibacter cinnamivorans]SMC86675.1 aspartyl-tRNA synthetase [Papillibacter cinnamivorans DSM 12816]